MLIGYARVSTEDQNLDLQRDALTAAGCETIFDESGVSGAAKVRPALRRLIRAARPGDVIVVWRLDRLGRSLRDLIDIIERLRQREIGFVSLREQIDTTSAAGRFYLHMLGALAEFERELIRDRTRAGMAAARERGIPIGRPRKMTDAQAGEARRRLNRGESADSVAAAYGVSVPTLHRMMTRLSLPMPNGRR